ncbi:hypothetical protein F4782DRAFT_50107 [Xylaria castorea]|nr:hypothetical protein F4782DRAFT_50107 [Xylaria castorea]
MHVRASLPYSAEPSIILPLCNVSLDIDHFQLPTTILRPRGRGLQIRCIKHPSNSLPLVDRTGQMPCDFGEKRIVPQKSQNIQDKYETEERHGSITCKDFPPILLYVSWVPFHFVGILVLLPTWSNKPLCSAMLIERKKKKGDYKSVGVSEFWKKFEVF